MPHVDHSGKIDVEDWLGCSLVEHSLHVAPISYEVLSAVHDLLPRQHTLHSQHDTPGVEVEGDVMDGCVCEAIHALHYKHTAVRVDVPDMHRQLLPSERMCNKYVVSVLHSVTSSVALSYKQCGIV